MRTSPRKEGQCTDDSPPWSESLQAAPNTHPEIISFSTFTRLNAPLFLKNPSHNNAWSSSLNEDLQGCPSLLDASITGISLQIWYHLAELLLQIELTGPDAQTQRGFISIPTSSQQHLETPTLFLSQKLNLFPRCWGCFQYQYSLPSTKPPFENPF